jgi:hypothetical protein
MASSQGDRSVGSTPDASGRNSGRSPRPAVAGVAVAIVAAVGIFAASQKPSGGESESSVSPSNTTSSPSSSGD